MTPFLDRVYYFVMKNNGINKGYSIVRFNLLTSLLSLLNRNDENDTDFVIARYFLNHLRELKDTSIYKIADECYVSRSSVQRFIKNIGYDSFTSMKASIDEIIAHEDGFIDYTDHTDYLQFISQSITEMMKDIGKACNTTAFAKLLGYFEKAGQIVLLTAEDSSHACKVFQQQMMTTGKLIRIITSASHNTELLNSLKEDDLLLVCSVTGNYALAINDQLQDIKAKKCLITLNHTTVFEKTYRFIFYLSENIALSSNNIVSARNVYNNYGLTFFFDLFFHECFVRYQVNK